MDAGDARARGCYTWGMDTLVAALLRFAVSLTGYPEPATPPPVQLVPAQRMPCTCIGVMLYPSVVPAYGHPIVLPARILLQDSVDLHGTHGASILLHELVHLLQASEGAVGFGSPAWHAREREAYRVQQRFLLRHGASGMRSFGLAAGED